VHIEQCAFLINLPRLFIPRRTRPSPIALSPRHCVHVRRCVRNKCLRASVLVCSRVFSCVLVCSRVFSCVCVCVCVLMLEKKKKKKKKKKKRKERTMYLKRGSLL